MKLTIEVFVISFNHTLEALLSIIEKNEVFLDLEDEFFSLSKKGDYFYVRII